ncbi:ATP-binding protein [Chitinophaga rhizosphaerae]|uniref:ATP-binding protein n=1 Tax=Chitinophaga rhizosphaerae TaxID=1864947 RepID=UPI000F80AB0E|nr:ATP-binding protein [Chitinophaga rhizosphaerae]
MNSILNSPFKFLDPYGREDYNIFFGRDEEVNALYQHIHKNRLVLVYGTSGTGKTSIVQCGLQNRMDDTDWFPLFIRRGDQLVESLLSATQSAADPFSGEMPSNSLSGGKAYKQASSVLRSRSGGDAAQKIYEALKGINLRYLRSVYLIFDQFEELLIMGTEEEKKTIIEIIDHILCDPDLQFCNFLLIMREEFFAGLSPFERAIPDFCDRRLRIEPMSNRNVEEVIVKSCERFNIRLEQGADNAKEIISVLSERQTVSLPYLQIYLDQLWRTVYMNTPDKPEPSGSAWPPLTVNSTIIRQFGSLQRVLDRFMHERIHVIQEQLEKDFPDIEGDFVANVLDAFVTSEGTKRPLPYARVNDGIWFTGLVPPYLQGRSSALMTSCLTELEKNKILRSDGQTYELAHDILAGLIDNRRTEEQRKTGFTEKQIISRYEGYKNNTSELLSLREIASYEPYMKRLSLPAEVIEFYRTSVNKRHADLLKEKRQKFRQRLWRYSWVIGVLLLVGITFTIWYVRKLQREFNRNESLVYMGFDLAGKDAREALGLFKVFRDKVYGEDAKMVDEKLQEIMQLQKSQALFAVSTYSMPFVKVDALDIDLSDDGKLVLYNMLPKETQDSLKSYQISTIQGANLMKFDSVPYAYFVNGSNLVAVSKRTIREEMVPTGISTKGNSRSNRMRAMYWLRNEGFLYDPAKDETIRIPLETGQQLHDVSEILKYANDAHESYHIQATASGNLIVPYVENGRDRIMLLNKYGKVFARFAASSTVTVSRDRRKFMYLEYNLGYYPEMHVVSETGVELHRISGEITFTDFTDDGSPLWGTPGICNILNGADTLIYDAPFNRDIHYAYANLATEMFAVVLGTSPINVFAFSKVNGVNISNFNNGATESLPGFPIGIHMGKGYAIMLRNTHSEPGATSDAADTIFRYDFRKKTPPRSFVVAEGVKDQLYNAASGDVMVYTQNSRLLVLDSNLTLKKGLMLTSNDLFGMSNGGQTFFYARDRYLTIFHNDTSRLNVFDPASIWAKLYTPGSPVQPITDRKRLRELGLHFK